MPKQKSSPSPSAPTAIGLEFRERVAAHAGFERKGRRQLRYPCDRSRRLGKVERMQRDSAAQLSPFIERVVRMEHQIAAVAASRGAALASGAVAAQKQARPRLRSIPKSHRPGRSPPAWKPCPGREHKRGGRKRVWPKKQLVVTHRWLDQGRVPREIFAVLARWNGSKGARRQGRQAV